VQEVAKRATHALPDANGRIERAVIILTQGGVTQTEHGYSVQSLTDPAKRYALNGTCPCPDAATAPHLGMCQHRIAAGMHRRVQTLLQGEAGAEELPVLAPVPRTAPVIPPQYVQMIQGNAFIKYAGLLALAHEKGLLSLSAEWTYNDSGLSLARAVAVFPFGTFTECGDATPDTVTKKVSPHFRRVALTRAKSRVLRDALNVDMVAVAELGEE
jgi:hypothetical protein